MQNPAGGQAHGVPWLRCGDQCRAELPRFDPIKPRGTGEWRPDRL